ncbi:MAG TPA: cytochrome c oxidase assembly protein [Woeseiaceae bacterium]|nr:cytochrome c oxidase assembly protein [Woeseiaceae bacterium]
MSGGNDRISTRSLTLRLLVFSAGMFGFGYLLVPAYSVFCDITGLGGRTNDSPAKISAAPDETRTVDLEFVTTVNETAPWTFHPAVPRIRVHPGGLYEAKFVATNLAPGGKVAQAVPSVVPQEAADHLKKIDCFCFTTQPFEPKEKRDLFVRFIIDRELPEYIDTVTLSYTLFDTGMTPEAVSSRVPDKQRTGTAE